ncbi:TM2 domain-containing protein [Balamuthia mandrillaris]
MKVLGKLLFVGVVVAAVLLFWTPEEASGAPSLPSVLRTRLGNTWTRFVGDEKFDEEEHEVLKREVRASPAEEKENQSNKFVKREDSGGGECLTDADCNAEDEAGTCDPEGKCVCDEKYAGSHCKHERKSKLVAFLLSLLVGGVGAGRFYLGYTGLGALRIVLLVLLCCNGVFLGFSGLLVGLGVVGIVLVVCGSILMVGLVLGIQIWWLVDWILVLTDGLQDSDGYDLYEDM